jgi:ABC-2 type transport system permease protein
VNNDILRVVRGELRRLRRWPAMWVIVGIWSLVTVLWGYVFNYLTYRGNGSQADGRSAQQILMGLLPASIPDVLIRGIPMFGGALILVLGAMTAGSGFAWGTWKTSLTQGPGRLKIIAGAVAALGVVGFGLMVLSLVLDLICSLGITAAEHQTVVWPDAGLLARSFLTGWLVLGMWALFGYLLGTLARGTALSIGLGLVWTLVVENMLRGIGSSVSFIDALTKVLPGTSAGSLIGAVLGCTSGACAGTPADAPGVLHVINGTGAGIGVCAYLVAIVLLAGFLVRRRDVA